MQPIILILLVLGAPLLFFISVYNTLNKAKVRIQEAWSQIDVQLKRRVDLIPNLVETVKGYMQHEKEAIQAVVEARSALMGAQSAKDAGEAENMLSGALKSLFAIAEAYPDLKAQEGFSNLQKELALTEDKIAYSRQHFNSSVAEYNERLVTFPTNLVAGMFGFKKEEYFEVSEADREPVKVDFTNQS